MTEGLTKRYPRVVVLDAVDLSVGRWCHRVGRRQRRGQVDAHQDPAWVAADVLRHVGLAEERQRVMGDS